MKLTRKLWILAMLFMLPLVYLSQGVLYPTGNVLAKGALALYLLIGLHALVEIVARRTMTPSMVIPFLVLLSLVFLNYIITDVGAIEMEYGLDVSSVLKGTFVVILTFFLSCRLAERGALESRHIVLFFCFLMSLYIIRFFRAPGLNEYEVASMTNNEGYAFVSLLPVVYLMKRNWSQIAFTIIVVLFAVLSAKRGAIVVGGSAISYYLFLRISHKSSSPLARIISVSLMLFAGFTVIREIYIESPYLQSKLAATLEGQSSGRDLIYSEIYESWLYSKDLLAQLFGNGFGYSVILVGTYAHNDWLELLSSLGLLGVLTYAWVFLRLFSFRKAVGFSPTYQHLVSSGLIVLFVKSLFSMGYMDIFIFPTMIIFGFVSGKSYHFQRRTNCELEFPCKAYGNSLAVKDGLTG